MTLEEMKGRLFNMAAFRPQTFIFSIMYLYGRVSEISCLHHVEIY